MVYKYFITTLCLYSTMLLNAEEKGLGKIIQKVADKKVLIKPIKKKQEAKKQSHFVFKDEYDANGIGLIDKSAKKNKSESYDYKNKSRFKFKFNDGSQQSNLIGGFGSGGISTSMARGNQGSGRAGRK